MINLSSAWKEEMQSGNRTYRVSAYVYFPLADKSYPTEPSLILEDDDIWDSGFDCEDAVTSPSELTIGSAIISQCTLTVNNLYGKFDSYDFSNAQIHVYLCLVRENDSLTDRIKKGEYKVVEPSYDGALINLTCYDDMSKFDREWNTKLTFPATYKSILEESCSECGVKLGTLSLDSMPFLMRDLKEKPTSTAITHRQIISWIAQMNCKWAKIDRNGYLVFGWFDKSILSFIQNNYDGGSLSFEPYQSGINLDGNIDTYDSGMFGSTSASYDGGYFDIDRTPYSDGDVLEGNTDNADGGIISSDIKQMYGIPNNAFVIYDYFDCNVGIDDVIITQIKVIETDISTSQSEDGISDEITHTYVEGENGYGIEISGNALLKEGIGKDVAEFIGVNAIGLTYRKASLSFVSDISIESGDVGFFIDVNNKIYPVIASVVNFSSGDSGSITSAAETPERNMAVQYSESSKNYLNSKDQLSQVIRYTKSYVQDKIDEFSRNLAEATGLNMIVAPQRDGTEIYYFYTGVKVTNPEEIGENESVMAITGSGVGFSTDGGRTFNYGVTLDGQTIMDIVASRGILAEWVKIRNEQGEVTADGTLAKFVTSFTSQIGELTSRIESVESETGTVIVASINITYATSDSNTVRPQDGAEWVSDMPTQNGKYIWQRTVISYSDGSHKTSYACISGEKGEDGTNGKTLSSIRTQYYMSTSNISLIGGSWSYNPTIVENRYIWTRAEFTWSDNTTSYSSPAYEGVSQQIITILKTAESEIKQLKNSISLTVRVDENTGVLRLGEGSDGTIKFTVDTDNFKVDEQGNVSARDFSSVNGKITAESNINTFLYHGLDEGNDVVTLTHGQDYNENYSVVVDYEIKSNGFTDARILATRHDGSIYELIFQDALSQFGAPYAPPYTFLNAASYTRIEFVNVTNVRVSTTHQINRSVEISADGSKPLNDVIKVVTMDVTDGSVSRTLVKQSGEIVIQREVDGSIEAETRLSMYGLKTPRLENCARTGHTNATSISSGYYKDVAVTFKSPMSATGYDVVATLVSNSASNLGGCYVTIHDKAEGGFIMRIYNQSGSTLSLSASWLAICGQSDASYIEGQQTRIS